MQNSGSPHLDLTGKLIIKVALNDDIRRIPIHNEEITYDELVLMMQRVYRGKLSTNDEITIKYKDEDGDLITIFDSSDLTFAIQCSRILKITLFVGGNSKSLLEPAEASMVRRELQEIRDRVISVLDKLEPASALVAGTQALNLSNGLGGDTSIRTSPPAPAAISPRPIISGGGKEFDPLTAQKSVDESTQNKVMSSFGMEGNVSSTSTSQYDRAATPDSISSVGSSTSNQMRAQQQPPQQPTSNISSTQQSQPQPTPQQQPFPPQQQQPQQQQPMSYAGQAGYNPGQPGLNPGQPGLNPGQPGQGVQAYNGQSAYGSPQPSQSGMPSQQQQQPQHQQQHQPQAPPQQQFDPAMYGQYGQGYGAPSGPPGQAPSAPGQGQMMYGQPGAPNPYGPAPGMPGPQAKAPGYPPVPGAGASPGNPYSRGPSYGSYPRPAAGYPQ